MDTILILASEPSTVKAAIDIVSSGGYRGPRSSAIQFLNPDDYSGVLVDKKTKKYTTVAKGYRHPVEVQLLGTDSNSTTNMWAEFSAHQNTAQVARQIANAGIVAAVSHDGSVSINGFLLPEDIRDSLLACVIAGGNLVAGSEPESVCFTGYDKVRGGFRLYIRDGLTNAAQVSFPHKTTADYNNGLTKVAEVHGGITQFFNQPTGKCKHTLAFDNDEDIHAIVDCMLRFDKNKPLKFKLEVKAGNILVDGCGFGIAQSRKMAAIALENKEQMDAINNNSNIIKSIN